MSNVGSPLELLELRDRVLSLEASFAELAKWTKFNQRQKNTGNNASTGAACPDVNVGSATASESVGTGNNEPGKNNGSGNQEGNLDDEICPVCIKAEVMDENYDQQRSGNGIVNPQGTSSDRTLPAATIPEAVSSTQRQNDGQMPSTDAVEGGSGSGVVEKGSNDKGVVPPQIKTEEDVICQCKLEDESDCDCSSGEDTSSISSSSNTARNKRSSKKKSTTATKSCVLELKSVFVSLKRLSYAQILSLKAVKSKRQWKCPHCAKIFSCKSQLEMHIRSHTGERPFSCPHCPTTMTTEGNLRNHIRAVHPKENHNFFSCRICQGKFPSQKILSAHMKKHRNIFKCYFCSVNRSYFSTMQRHLATHTLEKPLNCPRCRYATYSEGNLKNHEKTHK